ncbi:transcription factor [Dorcoceras hygrometricum]|uniref:Transcription factor n=1 Tax=Dorcoceras hygrometricum TaxID=472368 RepID=A0A2Z7BBJ5_9LAMI|nr:transcription factor [Dorcoceras hygrometricum]
MRHRIAYSDLALVSEICSAGHDQMSTLINGAVCLLLATIPSLELGESSEFPASKILSKKTVHRFVSINDRDGAEEVTGAAKKKAVSKKRPAADVGAAVPKKKRTFKKKSISSISSLELVEVAEEAIPIQQVAEPSADADDVDLIIQQVLVETREADAPADKAQTAVTEEKLWFDLPYDDLVKQWEAERPVVTASDTDEDLATVDVAPADGDQQVQESVAPISADDTLSADEQMSLDDILLTIPVDIPLPSSSMEITKITMGKSIKIPGVDKWTWFLQSLPRIPSEDKGKEVLVEKDPVKGNPAEEHFSLICADIELLEMYRKEEKVLSWGETESPQEAIQRKFYILLKYRTVLVWKFLEAWRANFAPGQGSSAVDIQVKVAPCADRWVKIPRKVISPEVPRQRQYDDTLPTMSVFFRLMRKRWADVCLEVVEFCAAMRLLPVGSTQFCRSLQLVEPVSSFASIRSSVFALRVSQFCSVFIDLSLFNWFPSAEITEFLSAIALDRTVLCSVQSFQNSFSVAPSVQLALEQQQSSSSSSSSSFSLHFDKTDVDASASSVPPVSQDLSAAFADLQANLSEQIFDYQSGLSSKLHKIEQNVCDSLRDQADIFRNLSQGARQEVRTLDDVQSIRFNEFRKNVLAQNASIFQGLADVRQEVQAVNAKVDIMASRLNAIQKDAEATKEALSHQLLEFQSQAQENHNVIHAQLSELVDYIHRGSADKKGESGSRGLQQPANTQIEGSSVTPLLSKELKWLSDALFIQCWMLTELYLRIKMQRSETEKDEEGKQAVGVFVRIQQMVCDQQLNGLSSSADRFIKSDQQNDVVGVHSFASADEVISRYFLEEFSSWLSLFVGDCDTTAFGLVGTTAFLLIQQKRSFDKPADALLGVNQQMYFKDSKTASLD